MVQQEVVITLRGTSELKEMLVTLSKLRHEAMNVVAADLIRKEHSRVMSLCTCSPSGTKVDCPLHGWGEVQVDGKPEPPNYVPPDPIRLL